MKTLLIDTRQQDKKHIKKDKYFEKIGIPTLRTKLPCGDYSLMQDMSVVVDTKRDIQEIIGNVCGKEHDRFRREMQLAQDNGIKMYVLIEDDGGYVDRKQTIFNKPVTCIADLYNWRNPRAFIFQGGKQKYPTATKGQTLAKALHTMEEKYGCTFVFCKSNDAGAKVLELLNFYKGSDENGEQETN